MVGAELVVGYVFAWVAGKVRRAGSRADGQLNAALDLGVDRAGEKLHALVAGRPGAAAALERLNAEAEEGLAQPSAVTVQWLAAVVAHAQQDARFAAELDALVGQVQAGAGTVSAGDGSVAAGGDVRVDARDGSFAAGVVQGDVRFGDPRVPGTGEG